LIDKNNIDKFILILKAIINLIVETFLKTTTTDEKNIYMALMKNLE
jgi:hypothetical protein